MLKPHTQPEQSKSSPKASSDEIGYFVLGVAMVAAGIRALATNQLSLPLWSISGWQAQSSGILIFVLGAILVIHAIRKRLRRPPRRDDDFPRERI